MNFEPPVKLQLSEVDYGMEDFPDQPSTPVDQKVSYEAYYENAMSIAPLEEDTKRFRFESLGDDNNELDSIFCSMFLERPAHDYEVSDSIHVAEKPKTENINQRLTNLKRVTSEYIEPHVSYAPVQKKRARCLNRSISAPPFKRENHLSFPDHPGVSYNDNFVQPLQLQQQTMQQHDKLAAFGEYEPYHNDLVFFKNHFVVHQRQPSCFSHQAHHHQFSHHVKEEKNHENSILIPQGKNEANREHDSTLLIPQVKTKQNNNIPGTLAIPQKKRETPKARNHWTKEEDELLKKAATKHNEKNWREIAEVIPGRNHVQCIQRWTKVLKPGLVKGSWSKEEDEKLLAVLSQKGTNSWSEIARFVKGRTAKQCRERWKLSLDPNINREPWTEEEDTLLFKLYAEFGSCWAVIRNYFSGRTENALKTRYNGLTRAFKKDRTIRWNVDLDEKLFKLAKKYDFQVHVIQKRLPLALKGISAIAIRGRLRLLKEKYRPKNVQINP